jgi:hypothetical protein
VAAAGWAGLRLLQLYSPPNPWQPFLSRTREFLNAAVAHDSSRLARLAASPEVARWALEAAARTPSALTTLRDFGTVDGSRSGETTLIVMRAVGGACDSQLLSVELVGSGDAAQVRSIHAPCLPPP